MTEQACHEPVKPTLALRFALAYLFAIGAGDRRYYGEFRRTMQERSAGWGMVKAAIAHRYASV